MSYVIIGVHGLANKPPKEQHAQDWAAAIQEGLTRNCSLSIQSINFDSVHWAHINYPHPLAPDPEPYIPTPLDQPIKTYRDGWLSILRAYISDVPGDMIQKAKEWFGLGPVTEAVLNKKLTDLGKYYKSNENRQTLRGLVKKAIADNQNKRITLIAHSMGSIIAYDALRELGQVNSNFRIENFVTIGSPLGVPTVAAQISEEWTLLRTPSIVKRWINLSDPRDPVAFDTHLRNDYEANDQGIRVEDDLILNNYVGPNDEPNHHKIYGYLRCPEMSELLRGIL
jgi:hypothetical protein